MPVSSGSDMEDGPGVIAQAVEECRGLMTRGTAWAGPEHGCPYTRFERQRASKGRVDAVVDTLPPARMEKPLDPPIGQPCLHGL